MPCISIFTVYTSSITKQASLVTSMVIYSVFYANLCNVLSGILGGILFKTGMAKVALHSQTTFFFNIGAGKRVW